MVEIKKLSYSYGEKDIIKDLNLNVKNGDTISIVGSSGTGKSTLLKAICNLQKPNDKVYGKILIDGILNNEFLKKRSGELGIMFQNLTLLPNLSVEKNILFTSKILNHNTDKDLYNEIVSMVGLKEHETKYTSELSGGMKTRVSLASLYMIKPKLLLLDEPFSSLDIGWKYELYKKFFELKNKYKTTEIIVTHDIQEAIILSNKVFILNKNGTFSNSYSIDRLNFDLKKSEDLKVFLKKNNENYLNIQNEILNSMTSE